MALAAWAFLTLGAVAVAAFAGAALGAWLAVVHRPLVMDGLVEFKEITPKRKAKP